MAEDSVKVPIGNQLDMKRGDSQAEHLLFLTDDRLRHGIELLFFAYRHFIADPDRILARRGLGRAHHRALHFIARVPGLPVAQLLRILGITKQSLTRVLGDLIEQGLVTKSVGTADRRQRLLTLTPEGAKLAHTLSEVQRTRVRRAYRQAGADAVTGFRRVLENLIDEAEQDEVLDFVYGRGDP